MCACRSRKREKEGAELTLFIVQAPSGDDLGLLKARFIKDGFAWGAFAFGWLWLAYHRLWLALAIWAVLEIAFLWLLLPHVDAGAAVFCDLLARLYVGLEGNRLRQAKGARAASLTDMIKARDRDEAEVLFYHRHASDEPALEAAA